MSQYTIDSRGHKYQTPKISEIFCVESETEKYPFDKMDLLDLNQIDSRTVRTPKPRRASAVSSCRKHSKFHTSKISKFNAPT